MRRSFSTLIGGLALALFDARKALASPQENRVQLIPPPQSVQNEIRVLWNRRHLYLL
jgi:hypothetical protein